MKLQIVITPEQIDQIVAMVAERLSLAPQPVRGGVASVAEAAEFLRVSQDTIYRYVLSGRLSRVPGMGRVLIPWSVLESTIGERGVA
jgi:excisionase family DNA binding protein